MPVDANAIFLGKPFLNKPQPLLVNDIKFPSDDSIVAKVHQYAKEKLPGKTFNHSMRVFYFGMLRPSAAFLVASCRITDRSQQPPSCGSEFRSKAESLSPF